MSWYPGGSPDSEIIKKVKGDEKMARLTLNLSNKLDKEMRQYIKDNDMTITTFIHLAISDYINKNTLETFLKEKH